MAQPIVDMRKIPRQARAAATIDAIVEAAAQILQHKGEAALTTATIAERAGVSIGSPIVITNVPKPATQAEFCGEVQSQSSSLSAGQVFAGSGGTLTITGCSFNGTSGTVSAIVSITSPIAMSLPYSATYAYE